MQLQHDTLHENIGRFNNISIALVDSRCPTSYNILSEGVFFQGGDTIIILFSNTKRSNSVYL